jgi:cyclic-di-AMP phosphodiesterase PgpH
VDLTQAGPRTRARPPQDPWARLPARPTAALLVAVLVAGLTALVVAPVEGTAVPPSGASVAATLLLVSLLVGIVGACFDRLRPGFWRRPRAMALLVCLLLTCALGARVMIPNHTLLGFVYPAAAVAMTVTVLLGLEMGMLAAMVLAVVMGLLPGVGAGMALMVFLGSLAGSMMLARVTRMSAFLAAGVVLAVTQFLLSLALELTGQGVDARALVELAGAATICAMLSTGLAVLGVVVAGSVFGVTTAMQLLDLARPDHPLLRELQQRAPGTWQHSVLLGHLAESAAQAIDEDPLLVRVGAYYHDIGKMTYPEYFVENQLGEANPHDRLAPEDSARLLIGHVAEGAGLARAHRLPEAVLDFIWQHHGTTKLAYFYRKAVEATGGEDLDDRPFRYPGPRPQTRAAALLMLADASEAAVRAARPTSESEIRAAMASVFRQRMDGGELDDSELTLRDLRRIRDAFAVSLRSLYHPRVPYPAEPQTTALEAVAPRADT